MHLEIWLAFCVASTIVLIIPESTIMLVASYALGKGRKSAVATVPGVALGDLTAMSISLAGAGSLLAASATAFTILKLCGAAYLVWLGIGMLRKGNISLAETTPSKKEKPVKMFLHAYLVTTLNPKGIIFFIAFVPQFISANTPVLPQLIILTTTFVTLAAINVTLWALMAGTLRERFSHPSFLRKLTKSAGIALIFAGLLTALSRRSSASF